MPKAERKGPAPQAPRAEPVAQDAAAIRTARPMPGCRAQDVGSDCHEWTMPPTRHYFPCFSWRRKGLEYLPGGSGDVMRSGASSVPSITDRGSHYWAHAGSGRKVDKVNLTQFGAALQRWVST